MLPLGEGDAAVFAASAMSFAVVGALLGSREHWERLESSPQERSVSLSPIVGLADRKAGLAVRFSF